MTISPKDVLLKGAQILHPVPVPNGFAFRFGSEIRGSGGHSAWGEFVRDDRRLEMHFRWSLGLVRYYAGNQNASHESYMRELGVLDQCTIRAFPRTRSKRFAIWHMTLV